MKTITTFRLKMNINISKCEHQNWTPSLRRTVPSMNIDWISQKCYTLIELKKFNISYILYIKKTIWKYKYLGVNDTTPCDSFQKLTIILKTMHSLCIVLFFFRITPELYLTSRQTILPELSDCFAESKYYCVDKHLQYFTEHTNMVRSCLLR